MLINLKSKHVTNKDTPPNKVARLIQKYELDSQLGKKLEELWVGNHEKQKSLRQLAEYFNKQLLTASVSRVNALTLDGDIDNIYQSLTDNNVSSGQREEVRNRLRKEGIDVDQLETDFVTYQAIRSYLKDYRNAQYKKPTDEERTTNVRETVQRLSSRAQVVTEDGLERLQKSSAISLGDFRVFVDINVLCNDCNEQYSVPELLEQEGCNCENKQ